MADSTIWWLVAGAAVVLELLSGTIYLLLLGASFAAAAIAAHLGAKFPFQLIVAATIGVCTVGIWYFIRRRRPAELPARANRSVNLDIGETLLVESWQNDGTATVRYRGAQWLAMPSAAYTNPETGIHRVTEVIGNRLVVEKA